MLKVRLLQAKGFRERRTEKHQHYGERQESSVQNGDRYRDVNEKILYELHRWKERN